ncbi:DUF2975 domain-containing protein [Sphingomonas humi]|uniref:DUF2975 domain-containing protein n=1 Tax=Sphingomonas humi TaxID=335630 RepID=A0ABP7RTA3_9SPHN
MLSVARWVLRALLVLNLFVGGVLLLLLLWSFADAPRFASTITRAFAGRDVGSLLFWARVVLAVVAPVMIAAHLLFRNLLAMLGTVEAGDPFVPANAARLQTVAWCLLAIQVCDLLFGWAATEFDTLAGERTSGWSPGITGWVAVLLVFVLARVFREGARLRDDAELTI